MYHDNELTENNYTFLRFVDSFFSPQMPRLSENIAYYSGAAVGCLSVAFSVPYGYNLGADNLGINSTLGKEIAGGYIAIVGTAALCLLTGRITAATWQAIVRGRPQEEVDTLRRVVFFSKDSIYKFTFNVLPTGIAILSIAPNILITQQSFAKYSDALAIFLDISAFLGIATIRSWALSTVFEKIFKEIKFFFLNTDFIKSKLMRDQITYKHLVVRNHLLNVLAAYLGADEADIDLVHHALFRESQNNEDSAAKLSIFINPLNLFQRPIRANVGESWPSYIFRNLGSAFALIYPYAAYVLGKDASDALWELLDVQDQGFIDFSSILIGATSYLAVSAISALAINAIFSKFYTASLGFFMYLKGMLNGEESFSNITKQQLVDMLLYSLFSILALSSTAPKAKVSISTVDMSFYGGLVVFSTIISSFSSDLWAWTSFKEEKFSTRTHRQILLQLLDSFINKLDSFDDVHVTYLFNLIAQRHRDSEEGALSASASSYSEEEASLLSGPRDGRLYSTLQGQGPSFFSGQHNAMGEQVMSAIYSEREEMSISALRSMNVLTEMATGSQRGSYQVIENIEADEPPSRCSWNAISPCQLL